ncbi:unnamed protein product [Paramecium octaurelia]|uniref:NACHT domain-containing protein n=1 Tax=Paramecium octaurelia TaxID=43137 RepID=A0A8S1Y6E1_PAROT|nr:unnamed protein product [Paramecium octaurelia]
MSQSKLILRGGGCGAQKATSLASGTSKSDNQDLHAFFNKFNFYVEKICTKAVVAADHSESQEIMIALQWFIFQEENIYNLNKNAQRVVKSYDLILEGIRKLLKSCLIYIRTDSFKCLNILQTTASLSKVIFSFHILNEERFMKWDQQQEFLDISDELSQHIEIEKNDLIQNQMELYLFLTKTSFEISPNNSNEREEILKGCLSGIIGSLIQMKPNEELLESLFQGAYMLQWEIISYFKNEKLQNLEEILLQIEEIHDKIVKNSNLWKYHYLWVQMIGKILQYNPLLTKQKLSQLINSFNFELKPDQIWKEYQRKGLLIQLNHSNDQAVIQLHQLQNNQLSSIDRKILETCFKEWEIFLLLKDFLQNDQFQNIPYTFGSYLKSKLVIEGKELQRNELIFAINKINNFLGFMISNKLLSLSKQNDEKLEDVRKIFSNFMKVKQYNESTTLKISQQQIKKIIQKLEEYFQNIQDIRKILSLNQDKLKKRNENKNFEKLNKLLSLQEILELYILEDERHKNENDATQEWRNLIFDDLKVFDLKEYKLSFLELSNKNKSKIFGEIQKLIEIYQKEIQELEINQLQNNLLQYFWNLVNNLCQYYENVCNEIQNLFSEFNLHLKEIMIIMYQIEAVPSIIELKKIKQAFDDNHLLKFLENLMYQNLKLKFKLVASKKSFSLILEKSKPEELRKLSEDINLDEFLLNVIEEFPKKIMRKKADMLLYTELRNIEITQEDFEYRLSKQKGIINYLIFKQSLKEKMIEQEEKDLELFEKAFGELFIKQSPMQKIKKIFEQLKVDESIKKVMDEKFNQSELRLEKEKYDIFLFQLKQIENFKKCLQVENWNKLILQTETVIQTLENFGCPDKETIKMLINEELIQLQAIIRQQKINYEEYEIGHEIVDIADNEKCHQIEQIQLIDLQAGINVVANQNGKKFNFSSNESYRTYQSFIIKVVKLKKLILKDEMLVLHNLFEELVFFSKTLKQIEKYTQEIQTKFQQRFQCCIQEFIQKFENLQFSQVNLDQKEDENFHSYLESLETKLFNRVNDKEITQIKINIFDFLNCLECYLQDKLEQKQSFSNIQVKQDFLIQQIKKIYLEEDSEVVDEREESKKQFVLLDNMVQRFNDFTNNEQWKIKQGLVFTIIQISSNCFSDSITSFCQKVLIQLWVQEKDQRVRNVLKNQHLASMQMQILQKDWSTQHDRIAKKMSGMLRRIDELQEQIFHETNLNKRDLYMKELDETTEQLDQQIENISEMGQQLKLITDFVNHIRKGLIRVEGKINEMKEQLKNIGTDIKFLRGKSVEQLFEIRKWKVLKEAAYRNAQTIYVPLQTLEIFQGQQKVGVSSTCLMNLDDLNDRGGEVNKFLLQESPKEKKTVLLIHGQAGSGKSTIAKKIEEFIWKLHDKNQKIRNQVLIPVYISLPYLKNPVFQAVEEALRQQEYGFDQLQLKECKEMLEKKEFKFLLIMDSYDEMKLEHIQKNLYLSNKVNQIWSNPLVIFTTRSEIFTSSNYTTWFQPDKKEELKEIQLLKFNEAQMKEYLKIYTNQTIKKSVFEMYELQTQISKRGDVDINRFDNCWEKFFTHFQRLEVTNGENLLNEKQIESIQQFLKDDEFIALKSTNALRSLNINLQKLWSIQKYEKMIKNINLNKLVENPYMMEIVVQVLPEMATKATEINNVKQNFFKNFPNMLKVFFKSKFLIQMYKLNIEIEKEYYNKTSEVTLVDLENLEIINYQEIARAVWNILEKNLSTIQFQITKDINDLNKNLKKINLLNIHVLQNTAVEKIALEQEAIIQLVSDALQEYNLTSYDFYEEFINQYHLKQIEKLQNLGKSININCFVHDLKKYSIQLAQEMTFRQFTQVQYQQKGLLYHEKNVEEEWLNNFFNDDCKNGNYKKDSIQEFLIAADLYQVLVLSQNLDTEILSQILEILMEEKTQYVDSLQILKNYESWKTVHPMNQQKLDTLKNNMQQTLDLLSILKENSFSAIDYSPNFFSETKKYLKQKIQKNQKIIELLKFLVYLTAIDATYIICGSNSLNLLVEMQVDLTSHNFQKIRIKNTSLIGGNFAKCNLSQSEFYNVNINGINLNGALMFDCKWKNLKTSDLFSLDGHQKGVISVCFSPDGTTLASGSEDASIRLWDIKTGQQKAILDGHQGEVKSVCFSPDSTTLASGNEDNSIRLWDVQTRQQKIKLEGHLKAVTSVNFSPDGATLASCSRDKSVRLWDVKQGQQKAKLDGHQKAVTSVNFSPDGTTLASCSRDKSIRLWDVKQGQQKVILDGHYMFVTSVNFSPDGTTLASGSGDKSISLWDVKTGQQKAKLYGQSDGILSVNFSPDGKTLASGSFDYSIHLWDVKTGQQKVKLDGHSGSIYSVNFSPDGTTLASGSEDASIRLWDVQPRQQTPKLDVHSETVYSVTFSPDGTTLASCSQDNSIRLWDATTGQQKAKLDGHQNDVKSVCFSPEGTTLASGSYDCSIRLWDVKTGQQKAKLDVHEHWVYSVNFSPDGTTLVSGSSDNFIRLWNVKTGQQKGKLIGHENWVYSVNFSPDGTTLASGSEDKSIRLWDVKTEQQKAILDGHSGSVYSVNFSPDGTKLASGSGDKSIRLWDVKTGQLKSLLKGHIHIVQSVNFSPDGTSLASGSSDNSIRLWDVKTGEQKAKLDGHLRYVYSVNFSPDGTTLASCSDDNSIRVWDIKSGQLINQNLFEKFKLPIFQSQIQNNTTSYTTILFISQQLIFQSKDALIFQGEFVHHLGLELKKLFEQRGSQILLEPQQQKK